MAIRQGGAISGGSRRRNQIAELNARQAMLPQIMANKQRQEGLEREDELNKIQQSQFSRQHGLAERQFDFARASAAASRAQADRASEVGMGLEATKLGTTLATQHADKTVGGLISDTKNMFGGSSTPSTNGFFNNLSVGSAVGGGLAGFGVSKMLGKKKSKFTKGLAGAGVGAALGLLGGGNSFGGAASGGFGGLIGGLFG